jgi:Mn-dependent DtxR family transcriptional regulator
MADHTDDIVLTEVREMGPITVAQIATGTDVSAPMVRVALHRLQEAGLVESDDYQRRESVWLATDVEPHVDNEGYEITR